jgi:hypothetical protein
LKVKRKARGHKSDEQRECETDALDPTVVHEFLLSTIVTGTSQREQAGSAVLDNAGRVAGFEQMALNLLGVSRRDYCRDLQQI